MARSRAQSVGFFLPYVAVLVAALVWAHLGPGVERLGPRREAFLLLLAVGFVWVAGRTLFSLKGWTPRGWQHWGAAVDLAIITAAVYLTGFETGETFLLYFWPIATFSIARLPWATMVAGVVSAALYVAATWPFRAAGGYATAMTFRCIILLITAALAAYRAYAERTLIEELTRLREEVALSDYRRRLSQELHDGIQHYLVNIGLRLELARRLIGQDPTEAAKLATDQRLLARQAADELRYVVRLLRSPAVEQEGFVEALRQHLAAHTASSSLAAPLEIQGEVRALPPELAHAAFRIVQEAITNAEKHAAAHEARVALTFSREGFRCTIRDDGVGFQPRPAPETPSLQTGFGLSAMKQRAESVGGRLEVVSHPGAGTEVVFTAPLA